jgi:arginyl-tRNA synthetase
MLQDWEQGQAEVVQLWEQMNGWVYQGFEQTYQQLGVKFDKLYYESNTYLKGKQLVEDNLQAPNSIFYREADGSVWIDLSSVKLDKKAVLRNDGTSMYITQDLGTALLRFEDFDMDQMIYVVGNEQEYHFQVLFEILKRLGYKFANNCHHLSYGMVNLTTGKMKSREGTVVDADDLIQKIVEAVAEESKERNTLDGLSAEEQQQTWHKIALSALKFFILKVEAKKTMIFDPKQSIDLQGQTGPYILNAYVRTQAVQRKAQQQNWPQAEYSGYALKEEERQLLVLSHRFPQIVQVAAQTYNPAEIANYLYELARAYHRFWNDVVILDKQDPTGSYFRLDLSRAVAKILFKGGQLLGMDMVERM